MSQNTTKCLTDDHKWVLEGIKEKLGAGRIETVVLGEPGPGPGSRSGPSTYPGRVFRDPRDQLVIPVGHGRAIHLHVEGTALKCAYGPESGIDLHSPDSIDRIVKSIRECIKWHAEYEGKEAIEDTTCHPCPLSSQDARISAIARGTTEKVDIPPKE